MPFRVPSLDQLRKLARSTIVNAVSPGGQTKRRRIEEALGSAVGGIQYLGVERLLIIWEQLWPDTATGRWLDRHGKIWGVARKDRAASKGKIKLPGLDGSLLPIVELEGVNADGETVTFTTDAETSVVGVEAFVTVTANVAGSASNLPIGSELTVTIGVPGFEGIAYVVLGDNGEEGIVGGLDLEDDEDYRARILYRIANPPQGGSAEDYVGWALEVPGITRAWCAPKANGLGTVVVFVVDDNSDPITPTAPKLAEVQAYLAGVAPVTDYITTAAPALTAIDLTVILSPNTAAVQAAVLEELEDFFHRRELGQDEPKVHLSQIGEAIGAAEGEDWHEITVPAASPDIDDYAIPVLGTVTFLDPP